MESKDVQMNVDSADGRRDSEGTTNDGPRVATSSRKRTKTGCLTCRRRRIKCGEERPTCGNCIKSKRQCEGYNQRVVFKEPVITWRGPGSSSVPQNHQQAQSYAFASQYGQFGSGSTGQHANLPNIRPKPTDTDNTSPFGNANVKHVQEHSQDGKQEAPISSSLPETDKSTPRSNPEPQVPYVQTANLQWSNEPISALGTSSFEHLHESDVRNAASTAFLHSYQASQNWSLYGAQQIHSHDKPVFPEKQLKVSQDSNQIRTDPTVTSTKENTVPYGHYESQPSYSQHEPFIEQANPSHAQDRRQQHMWEDSDEELYDVSDEESLDTNKADAASHYGYFNHRASHLENEDMTVILALQAKHDNQDQRLRTYHSVIDLYGPDILTTYRPSAKDSPLRDDTAARIFQHFINVLGPTISTNERNPANPSLIFQGHPIPLSQQHLWTYTMPRLALHDPALLHAMLAVSSFHIAKLQDVPITASLKHYHISIRRVAKNVSSPTKRVLPATLGAIMLLGFYELMSAEHQKWSDHLLGATQLIRQIEFREVANYIRRRKLQKRTAIAHGLRYMAISEDDYEDEQDHDEYIDPLEEDIDEHLISQLTGEQIGSEQRGRIISDDDDAFTQGKRYTKQDLATYETQRDLFWWYCKQDAYQSILSGNRLFMNFSSWKNCLPRAPVGRLHAIYGTYDHVMLLFGRVADFAAKDIKRKRQLLQANGGQWRPPSGMQMPGPARRPSQGAGAKPGGPPMSMFPGMMPDSGQKASLPRGFSPTRETTPESSDSADTNLEKRTREAEDEWHEIRAAFEVLKDNFGPDFQPLGDGHVQPIITPFGNALQYRTYGVAGIWMNYYLSLIVCYRAHPNMPPAALVAAGISAKQTEFYANEIGRISAGIVEDASILTEVNTQVGASLIETTIGLFIAGVQFQHPSQRHWTIQRLLDITRLTGWQTGAAIATGVETSWTKAAEMGRGPPYKRMDNIGNIGRLAARRRIDGFLSAKKDNGEKVVVSKQERVHYVLGLLGMEEDFQKLELPDQ